MSSSSDTCYTRYYFKDTSEDWYGNSFYVGDTSCEIGWSVDIEMNERGYVATLTDNCLVLCLPFCMFFCMCHLLIFPSFYQSIYLSVCVSIHSSLLSLFDVSLCLGSQPMAAGGEQCGDDGCHTPATNGDDGPVRCTASRRRCRHRQPGWRPVVRRGIRRPQPAHHPPGRLRQPGRSGGRGEI